MDAARARKDALAIFNAGIKAVDAARALEVHLRFAGDRLSVGGEPYDLNEFDRVFVIGAGKAAADMAQAMEEICGKRVDSGLVITKYGHTVPLKRIRVIEAGHPFPDEAGYGGCRQVVRLLESAEEKDLVFFLISGGGSALLPYPAEGLTLKDKQEVTKILLDVGADIHEINTLRKHLSRIKGGRLAKWAYPATLISLILSDVIGDDLDSIASGPTVPDPTTFGDCIDILEKYGIAERIPVAARRIFEKGSRGEIAETPKTGDPAFERTQNLIVGNNTMAVKAAAENAVELGYNTLILSTSIAGETRDVAGMHVAIAREILNSGNPINRPACVLSGGETTVTIRGKGKGGRNQEFSLAAAVDIDGMENVVVLSVGTDGTDGPTDAAGAISDGESAERARMLGMDPGRYLRANDSFHFFEALDDLIITGPTHTNVMDLRIILVF